LSNVVYYQSHHKKAAVLRLPALCCSCDIKKPLRQFLLVLFFATVVPSVGFSREYVTTLAQQDLRSLTGSSENVYVVDFANSLPATEEQLLNEKLIRLEQETGVKIRLLTTSEPIDGSSVKKYWNLDQNSVLIYVDTRGGNILNFLPGQKVKHKLKDNFWYELQSRYGNLFYVEKYGEDGAIITVIQAVESCLKKDGVCERV